eukprot:1510419-Rhodomonas_salina.4
MAHAHRCWPYCCRKSALDSVRSDVRSPCGATQTRGLKSWEREERMVREVVAAAAAADDDDDDDAAAAA